MLQTSSGRESLHAPAPPSDTALLPISASGVSFDWRQVAIELEKHGHSLDLDFTPRRFAGGLANINMLLKIDGTFAVFRRPPDGPLQKGAHDMAREHRVLKGLAPILALAPRSLHYCSDVAIAGAPFQILEYRGGRVLRGTSLEPLPETPETGAALSNMLLEALARIHAVSPAAAGLAELGRPEGFMQRTAQGWIARAEAVLDGKLPTAARELVDWLQRNHRADDAMPVLLHNDFKLDNILLHNDDIAPSTVLDWDMATRGDALFDLATLLSYWVEADDPPCMMALNQMPTARPGFFSREEAAARYAILSGRPLEGFVFPRVLAMFRLGIVFHQLSALHAANPDRLERFSDLNPDDIFAFSLDVASGRTF